MTEQTNPQSSTREPITRLPITRALVSVYDKTGIEDLARALQQAGVEVVSTGSTARALQQAGVAVRPVEEVTGSPEVLDGRVKTLHPVIHAGILADRRLASHRDQLDQMGVAPFDLVVSNLYPFEQTVASGASFDETIEQIDIGGPSMVRGAAKNHANVAIITDPSQYPALFEALERGGFTAAERLGLATAAFQHTATYDMAVAGWLSGQDAALNAREQGADDQGSPAQSAGEQFLPWISESLHLVSPLRYGENAHQQAALYAGDLAAPGLVQAQQLHGKAMSFNNYTDGEAAYRTAYDFTEPTVAIIKHANPCGIASADDIATAHRLAHQTDPVSAYGGVVAANRPVSLAMAEQVAEIFTEVLIAPGFEDGALEVLQRKKNIRVLLAPDYPRAQLRTQKVSISGGALVQFADRIDAPGDDPTNWQLVSGQAADAETLADLEFAWRAVRSVKSNAILLAQGRAAVGVGMGQVNRVDSCRLAVQRSDGRCQGAVAASDAFFPFADGAQVLIDAGVRAIVQPGGSVRDAETIEAAQQAGVTMYLTGTRHFFH